MRMKCSKCGRWTYRKIYVPGNGHGVCAECGSSIPTIHVKPSDGVNVEIFKHLVDENIDGVPRYFSSKRKHNELIKRHEMRNKHYG